MKAMLCYSKFSSCRTRNKEVDSGILGSGLIAAPWQAVSMRRKHNPESLFREFVTVLSARGVPAFA